MWTMVPFMERFEFTKFLNNQVDSVNRFLVLSSQMNYRLTQAYDQILQDAINNNGDLDLQSWVALGQVNGALNIPEFAYHCYYMGHLQHHGKIKTNSDLKFETNKNDKQPQNSQAQSIILDD